MRDVKALLIAVAVFFVFANSGKIQKLGPYELLLREWSVCQDQGTREFYINESSMSRIDRTSVGVIVRINSKIPFDDSIEIYMNNAVWGNGGWRPNALTYKLGPACTVWKKIQPYTYDTLFVVFEDLFNATECPIPPTSAHFTITFSMAAFKGNLEDLMPKLPYGRYKSEVLYKKDGQIKGCLGFIVDVVPISRNPAVPEECTICE